MGKINVLDKHVAELIAAGEVVERPSSVIKELVENSIDAGATNITVEIQSGGISYMRVSDNGSGILKDDIRKAFIRHATSKVKIEDDLSRIGTLGFRGEALASISSVSHLELITKTKDEDEGTRYIVSGGEEKEFSSIGCPEGTTFIIRDLFYNVPARLKFLKSNTGEGNAISNVIDKIALSHPEISINYIKDSKPVLKTSGDNKLFSSIYSVYGKQFADSLIPVDYSLNGVKVTGFTSKPEFSRPNRNMQNFFLNGRYVISKTFMAAISEAYKGSVMVGKFPSCVLHVSIPFDTVDVNVHPTKLEVRFVNERPIFDAIYHAIKTALMIGDTPINVNFNKKVVNPFEMAKKVFREREESLYTNSVSNTNKKNNSFHNSKNMDYEDIKSNPLDIYKNVKDSKFKVQNNIEIKKEQKKEVVDLPFGYIDSDNKSNGINQSETIELKNNRYISESKNSNINKTEIDNKDIELLVDETNDYFKYIGELFSTYIMVEVSKNEIILIDKHAAHEKIIYEQLKKDKGSGNEQLLLIPVTVTLDKTDYDSVISNIALFKKACFDVEDFGNGTVLVRSVPQYLTSEDVEFTIEEMAGYLSEHKTNINTEKMDWIYHNISCRAAIKAGNKSSRFELEELAKKVLSDDNLKHCPHGRPICISITKKEIEKSFGRI